MAFSMTSFAAKSMVPTSGFKGCYKIQGQIYHKLGSLQAPVGATPGFLQIYFTTASQEANERLKNFSDLDRDIVEGLQTMLHENNSLIQSFKTALETNPTDEARIVIKADKTPAGKHKGRFNAPTTNEVAVLLVNQEAGRRDIVLKLRSNDPKDIQIIDSGHRKYDALQYPDYQ